MVKNREKSIFVWDRVSVKGLSRERAWHIPALRAVWLEPVDQRSVAEDGEAGRSQGMLALQGQARGRV